MNNIGLIDIGANLTHPELYNQLDKIVENLQSAHIKKVIITSSNLEDTKTALNIINLYPDLFYTTVGFHPHNAKDFSSDDVDKIHDYGEDKNIVAIGECGLDYYREYSTKEQQIYCFEEQLLIAESLELPVFLHERHAHKDFAKILYSILNCWSLYKSCFSLNF